uniref:Uncharacterized protein n=1 Tax=Streptomyces sp. FQ1 TaxID=319426 RepID=Q58IK2_9ACTN|nr:hypothetical protein [Streptomyces sp. FQ1]AAX51381.1 unknown [Streptomyces sp. FQ1]
MTPRAILTPRTEPVGTDGFTLRERSWKREADKHVAALNALLAERGAPIRFAFPAPVAVPFEGPGPDEAYAGAAPLDDELADVLALSTALLQAARAGTDDVADERELLLRRAALLDRLALAAPHDATAQSRAIREAHILMTFDVVHHCGRGPFAADSIEADGAGGPRAYVRQEYAAWHTPIAPGEGI